MKTLAQLTARDENSFGLLRLFAALMVIVSHGFMLTAGSPASQPLYALTGYPLGGHAVHMFFTLSGFLIAASWHAKPDVFHFLAGRSLRLYPALIVVTMAIIIGGTLFLSQPTNLLYPFSTESILFFVRTVLFLDGGGSLASILPQDKLLGAILATVWTLKFELLCYFSIPILAVIVGPKRAFAAAAVGIILLLSATKISIFGVPYNEANMVESLARFFFAFYLGVAAWMLRDRVPVSATIAVLLLVVAFFSLNTIVTKPLQIIAVAYLAFWLGSLKFGALSRLTNREDISYGVYLIGYPVQQSIALWLPVQQQSALFHITTALLITVPLAYMSWRFVEKPALRHRNSLADSARYLCTNWTNFGSAKAHAKPRSAPTA